MNGRVIFIGTKYWPTSEQLKELQAMQERLHYYRVEFLNSIKRESPWQQAMAHERFRNRSKELLRVIEGGLTSSGKIVSF